VTNIRRLTALAGPLAGALAVGSAGTVLAATVITVTVTGGGTFPASASPVTLTTATSTFTCATATAILTINNQTGTVGTAPLKIGTATNFVFSGCTGPLGAATLTPKTTTYKVSANSVTDPAGQTDLIIAPFDILVSTGACTFHISGSAPGWYNNPPVHSLGMGPIPPTPPIKAVTLKVTNATGCTGVVSNGQQVQFTATYTVNTTGLDIESTSGS
jgi:hypothetical protein